MNNSELNALLNPENKLQEGILKIKRLMFNQYPRKLSKAERLKLEDQKAKQDLEELFQQHFGLEDDD